VTLFAERYELLEELGSGQSGSVRKAYDYLNNHETVAIKLLD